MILVGGGSRSGKTAAALALLEASGARRGFIATAQAFDREMEQRIAQHRASRAADIVTWEDPFAVADRLLSEGSRFDGIAVDCLTLWLTNLMLAETYDLAAETERLIDVAASVSARVILVTNEVGCGIVPENALARRFRDEAGRLNQLAARRATEVYWTMFGIGMRIK